VIGAAAVAFALLPFSTSFTLRDISGRYPPTAVSCGPPVVEATRTPPKEAGWFGYAPLTSTRPGFTTYPCYEPARQRLAISAIGLFLAVLLGWWSFRIEQGNGRARRWRPRPA
jgi:hypothetical protein